MARDDDSFWLDIFKKSPLIAIFMAVGGVLGLGIGIFLAQDLVSLTLNTYRWFFLWSVASTCGGIFVGLILGVIVDSIWGAIRGGKDRKPPRKR